MGYSARYHVASLAAVFLALAVGILIGAGFGDDLVRSSTENLEASLKGDLTDARGRINDLERDLGRERQFGEDVYPALVAGRLRASRVAVVAFGGLDDQLSDDLREALAPSGGRISQVAVVTEPPDADALVDQMSDRFAADHPRTLDALAALGRRAGRDLVAGGGAYERLSDELFGRFSGEITPVQGVVVARARPSSLSEHEDARSGELEDSIIDGLAATGAPVVGVQESDADPSSVGYFESRDISTVDDVDLAAGKVAVVYALAGDRGNYGIGSNADTLLPDALGARPGTIER